MWSLSDKLTEYYLKNNTVEDEKIEIYRYGFKLIISDIINFIIIMVIGLLSDSLFDSICFLVVLVTVRRFSGGFHAKTFLLCRISMIITFICVIIASHWIIDYIKLPLTISLIIDFPAFAVIFCLSPVENVNKILNERQRKINKRKAVITSSVCIALSVIMVNAGIDEGVTISLTLAAIAVLMLIGIAVKKRGENNV